LEYRKEDISEVENLVFMKYVKIGNEVLIYLQVCNKSTWTYVCKIKWDRESNPT